MPGGAPLWLGFLGDVGKAMAVAALGNKFSQPLPRPGGALLRRRRRGRRVSYRSLRRVARRQVSPLAFCSLVDSRIAEGLVEDGWPDLVRFFLCDGGRRQRWGLEELGRVPGRCSTADGLLFYCDSIQRLCAKGLLQFMVWSVFFSGGDGRRRGDSWGLGKDPGTFV